MNGFQKVIKVFAICLAIFIIANICICIFSSLSLFIYFGNKQETSVTTKEFIQTYSNIERLDIDMVASNIEIIPGNEFKVEAWKAGTLTSKVVNGKLKLQENKKWFLSNNEIGRIIIYVPETVILKELDLDAGAGTVKIQNITAENVDLDQGAGIFRIENCNFAKADIDGGAGKIEIASSKLRNLALDCGAGKVELEAAITGNSKISAGIGEIDMTLLGNKDDYQITAEKGIGSIKIDGNECSSNITYGMGTNRLKVDGGIGSIRIQYRQK